MLFEENELKRKAKCKKIKYKSPTIAVVFSANFIDKLNRNKQVIVTNSCKHNVEEFPPKLLKILTENDKFEACAKQRAWMANHKGSHKAVISLQSKELNWGSKLI